MRYQQRIDAGARYYAGYMHHYDAECRPMSGKTTTIIGKLLVSLHLFLNKVQKIIKFCNN
jgi:hypothetical protein